MADLHPGLMSQATARLTQVVSLSGDGGLTMLMGGLERASPARHLDLQRRYGSTGGAVGTGAAGVVGVGAGVDGFRTLPRPLTSAGSGSGKSPPR
jgi:hypothetical protein